MPILSIVEKIFGSRNTRVLKQIAPTVTRINTLEQGLQTLTDNELAAKTTEFKQRINQGESLDAILPEAFAVVREASRRVLNMRHFDVQLIGGIVLHRGCIAEMRTGEGKTLMSTLAAYLNALSGEGVHVITVNDYLARRDAQWMGKLYHFLGLSVGVVLPDMPHADKQAAYVADITYGTNNEFGFDYLRDNMAFSASERVQRGLNYAIIDEVDSILIDEARTPLVISGMAEDSSDLYQAINLLIPLLKKPSQSEAKDGDYILDEKSRQAFLTEAGHQHIEELLIEKGLLAEGESLYDANNISLMHHVNAALRAHTLYQRDVDYIIKNGEIVIVDEHTGRTMPGRRWSEGLHQAIEAKENVTIQHENQTLASITFQNYFRMYDKLSGMTGTADTEAYEFQQIYSLEVIVIPTNRPMIRQDLADLVYLKAADKYAAVIADIKQCLEKQRPVLVGTISIETSEYLSTLLKKEGIKHQVLNAKFHEQEAQIVAEAGRPSAVTIATNMAGRGTDIVLGGNLEAELAALGDHLTPDERERLTSEWKLRHETVVNAGGLHIIGTERHESRRIDNQLRGRAGRQGDSGSSRFYLSLEDNLMRIFAADRMTGLMQRLGMDEHHPIEHPLITRAIAGAQRKVEGRNFDMRKQLLEYDDVANQQRQIIYRERNQVLEETDISSMIQSMRVEVLSELFNEYIPADSLEEQWDVESLQDILISEFAINLDLKRLLDHNASLDEQGLLNLILAASKELFENKEQEMGSGVMRHLEKTIMLQCLDNHWREHLAAMDYLRQGIHLRGYAQKDPRQEYKRESFNLFNQMLENIRYATISFISLAQVKTETELEAVDEKQRHAFSNMNFEHIADQSPLAFNELEAIQKNINGMEQDADLSHEKHSENKIPYTRTSPKISRNELCPCGSGKKFKHCHGMIV